MTSRNISNETGQYDFPDASLVSAPTVETSLALEEEQTAGVAEEAEEEAKPPLKPILQWDRRENPLGAPQRLYIHEKIQPLQFIDSLMKRKDEQGDMFGSFNNLPEGAHYEPYVHSGGNWSNRFIRSTGQRAMNTLLNKEGMGGQVDLAFMDPPYNINFRSNFQGLVTDAEVGEKWGDLPQDIRTIDAFRDTYERDVHSYLDQLRSQFVLARELLAESGSMIVQIGAQNLHYVALALSEVFGHENHVATIPYQTSRMESKHITEIGNWLVWFAKDKSNLKYRQLYEAISSRVEYLESIKHRGWIETPTSDGGVKIEKLTAAHRKNPSLIPSDAKLYSEGNLHSVHTSSTGRSDSFYLHPEGKPCPEHADAWDGHSCSDNCDKNTRECPFGRKCGNRCHANAYPCRAGRQWSVSHRGIHSIAMQGRIHFGENGNIVRKHYESDVTGKTLNALWGDGGRVANKEYIVETPARVLDRCVLMTTDPGDLVLDLTCGSGAMPVAAERWGRRWIAVDVSATSIALARERMLATLYDYHLLKDSRKGHERDHELEQAMLPPEKRTRFIPKAHYGNNPALGFVNERQMRVSAATLAYGPKEDGSDVIRHPDRLEKDTKRVRAASAFRVESDLPYKTQSPDEAFAGATPPSDAQIGVMDRMVKSLETTGITVPGGQGKPHSFWKARGLEPAIDYGTGVTHKGELVDEDGAATKALFYICRDDEVATEVLARNLRTTAMNKTQGKVAAVLVFFSGESLRSGVDSKGRIREIRAVANLDHLIPELAASRSKDANAFTLISEPEVEIHEEGEGLISLEVKDLVVYNPRSGQVEPPDSRFSEKIAGVMTDTDYDQESFKARLVNLPRKGKAAQQRLKRMRAAFRREIDEKQWKRMQTLRTLPFPRPESGVVAVKVIDYTGLEHLQTIQV